jgi:signal transduction histidine kinase
LVGSQQRSKPLWTTASGYLLAVGTTLLAFAATVALKKGWPTPSFMFFIPAVAISAWFGGLGPSILATAMSLALIRVDFLEAGWIGGGPRNGLLAAVAFLVVAVTIAVTMEALRRARALADSHAANLERLNTEVNRSATRATRLLGVTSALLESQSIEDVADVVLGKGLGVVEAMRGSLVCADGDRVWVVGARGYSPELEARAHALTLNSDVPLMDAFRRGESIWIGSAAEYRQRYAWSFGEFGVLSDTQAHVATPLIHEGEKVGSLSLSFSDPSAFGAADRAFTLLLAQATAAAIHRARSYNAEREKRREAEVLARAREDALGVVAHDLRNPLNLILTTAELMIDEELPLERRREMLSIAIRAAKEMNRLIADLLDTVRLQAGRLSLNVEDVSVDAIIKQAEETFRPLAERRHLRFEAVAQDGASVRADPTRVSQIVGNLIGNAIKFTPEQGSVKLRAIPNGKQVVFQVIDNGPGITPDNMSHLFDNFWQARKDDRRGVGLGLAIVKELVEAHGGKIWVESKVDQGSTFSFSLPAVSVPADRPETTSS